MKKIIFFFLLFYTGFATAQWSEQTSGVTSALFSVSAVNDNVVWACGLNGTVLVTVNSGVVWSMTTSPNAAADFYTIQGIDASTAVVGGMLGSVTKVYKTIDGGATWTETFSQSGGFVNSLKKLKVLPGLVALQGDPVGGRWTLFFSLDDGSTWDSSGYYIPASPGEAGWNNSYIANDSADRAWFGTNSTKVIQYYSDGTYANRPTTGLTDTYSIWGNDQARIMTGGDKIYYTTDEGASWTDVNAIGSGDISGIVGGNTSIWYYTRGTSVYFSNNNGGTWSNDYTQTGNYFHMTLSPLGRYIWAVRDNGGISRKELDIVLPVELLSFTSNVINRDVNLSWSTVSETDNAGFEIERSPYSNSLNREWTKIGFVNGNGTTTNSNSYTYSDRSLNTGSYAYRLKQIDYNGNFNYHYLSNEVVVGIPEKFSLSQNFPNPFNPSTKINFDIPNDGNINLRVFDMTGKEVAVLVNEYKTAGYYTVSFNSNGLPSGVYFYTLSAGNLTSTKKMTLLK